VKFIRYPYNFYFFFCFFKVKYLFFRNLTENLYRFKIKFFYDSKITENHKKPQKTRDNREKQEKNRRKTQIIVRYDTVKNRKKLIPIRN
jgi:hypothetical protein